MTKFNSRLLYLITALVLTTAACSFNTGEDRVLGETVVDGTTVTEIDLGLLPSETESIGLSEFFSGLEVIKLDNTDEALAMNAMEMFFAGDFFLMGTQTSGAAKVLRFDYNGNFLNIIGREGGGPGEHTGYEVSTLEYYKDDNSVLVDWGGAALSGPNHPTL